MTFTFTMLIICLFALCYAYKMTDINKTLIESNKQMTGCCKNAIASLDPENLDKYLETVLTMYLQIEIALYGTEKDPDIKSELYGRAVVSYVKYLGTDTVNAIELRYGDGYVTRWFDARFKMLELSGEIDRWIANPPYSKAVRDSFEQAMQIQNLMNLSRASKGGA